MIVDTSALIALVYGEPEAPRIAAALASSAHPRISAASYIETVAALGPSRAAALQSLMDASGIDIAAVDAEQAHVGAQAYLRFGKGSGSPARLNLGDCFAYALAATSGEPLLFSGDNFRHTDLTPA